MLVRGTRTRYVTFAASTRSQLALVATTVAALLAFAGNSLLCRRALATDSIDPASYTLIRLAAGALVLAAIVRVRDRVRSTGHDPGPMDRRAPFLLFGYAIAFSWAYVHLGAGTGALLLFGAVQCTMICADLHRGSRPGGGTWIGMAFALAGLVALVYPGLNAPEPGAALLMLLAGVAWGGYSLLGRGVADSLAATTRNFVRSLPWAALAFLLGVPFMHIGWDGVALAVVSGAIASGLGYVAWYAVVPALGATRAAIVQLAVPALAAAAGVVLLGEPLTLRVLASAGAILGGVALALASVPTRDG